MKVFSQKTKYQQKEAMLTIKLTDDCNFRCPYCFQHKKSTFLDSNKISIIMKLIMDMNSSGIETFHIGFFGGEPLLNRSAMHELYSLLERSNIAYYITMTTNGYLLTRDVIETLKIMKVTSVQVTLDGSRRLHDTTRVLADGGGTYDVIFTNILTVFRETEMKIFIRFNMTKQNTTAFCELMDELDSAGIIKSERVQVRINEAIKHDTTEDTEFDDLIYFKNRGEFAKEELRAVRYLIKYGKKVHVPKFCKVSCPFDIQNNLVIGTNLELEYCSGSEKIIGHLDEEGRVVENVLNSSRLARDPFAKPKCISCNLLPLCMGGCALLEYAQGDYCFTGKYVLDDYIRYLVESKEVA